MSRATAADTVPSGSPAALSTPEYIWMNGAVRPWQDANVHVWTEVVLRAASVFEGLRGYWVPEESRHYFVHLDEHVRRLRESARVVRIPGEVTTDELHKALGELITALGYREDVYVRPTLYLEKGRYTSKASAVDTGFFMPVFQSPREPSIDTGVRCQISSWRRSGDQSAPPRVKAAANYYNLRLARLEAEANGFDESVLLNGAGKVAETGGASVFLVRRNTVITPRLSDSILESITRQSAIDLLANDLGMDVEVREVDRTELYLADEVFLTGTLCEITPVVAVDQFGIGDGTTGPVTRRLQQAYYDACRAGANESRGWLTAGPTLG
ncbi:branched-chain amino acid transaminase [Kitasatospora sp. NPDC089509]|uniref:branched-chain amino acid transaminase n=1 Tax=Kitasatospora sp. NPDC089509 TaxID=3364079 RepID=UPI0037F37EBE